MKRAAGTGAGVMGRDVSVWSGLVLAADLGSVQDQFYKRVALCDSVRMCTFCYESGLAGNVDGAVFVLVFFGGRMGGEPCLLLFDEPGGLFAEVADRFEGELAGDVVSVVVGRRLQAGGPAFGGFEELGESLANVAVMRAIVVEVVSQLVGDGGELLEEIVGVLLPAGPAWMGEERLYVFVAIVQKFNEDHDAVVGDIGRRAKLFDFGVGEDVIFGLSVQGHNEGKQNENLGKATEHAGLVAE